MGRANSDEWYVIDLCDEIIGKHGNRGHRFGWLLGDMGKQGRRTKLPVDVYYPHLKLIIEYRERQHYESLPHFDHRTTISGMNRAEQRRKYDALREEKIPQNGMELVIIRFSELSVRANGKLLPQ